MKKLLLIVVLLVLYNEIETKTCKNLNFPPGKKGNRIRGQYNFCLDDISTHCPAEECCNGFPRGSQDRKECCCNQFGGYYE